MDKRIKEIKNLEKKIKETEADIAVHYKTIGELILSDESGDYEDLVKTCSINGIKESVEQAEKQIAEIRDSREKITHLKKKIQSIDDELKESGKVKIGFEKDIEKHYIGIGETIFSIYINDIESYSELGEYFTRLLTLQEKIQEIDYKLNEKTISGKNSVFKKILDSSEKTLLLSRRKISASRFTSLYKDAGKKLCDDKIYEKNRDKQITGIFSAYINNARLIEEINIKIESLEAEKGNMEHDIYEIMQEFSGNNIADPESYLKGLIEKKENDYAEAGKTVYQCVSDKLADGGEEKENLSKTAVNAFVKKYGKKNELSNLVENVFEQQVCILEFNKEIKDIQKNIEIDRLENMIKENKDSVDKKNIKIKELKKEIDDINKIIKKDQEKADSLKKDQ